MAIKDWQGDWSLIMGRGLENGSGEEQIKFLPLHKSGGGGGGGAVVGDCHAEWGITSSEVIFKQGLKPLFH